MGREVGGKENSDSSEMESLATGIPCISIRREQGLTACSGDHAIGAAGSKEIGVAWRGVAWHGMAWHGMA